MAGQPEMKDFGAGYGGKQEGAMRLRGACLMFPFHFPTIPLSPRTSHSTVIDAFFSLGNEVNLRLQNQSQNNFAELECVQETSRNLTGSDFGMEMTVPPNTSLHSFHLGEDNKHSFSYSQSPRRKFPLCTAQCYFLFVVLFPSPFFGFPFPRSFFRRNCSSLKS